MTTFIYHGEDVDGNEVTNTVEADDRFKVYELARNEGHKVTSIEELSKFSLKSGWTLKN